MMACLSEVCAFLTRCRQEIDSGLPLGHAKTRLPCKVMDMAHEAIEEKLCPWVFAARVDQDHIVGNVIDREILHWRVICLRGIHDGGWV